jgi:hypothetical protein
MHSEVKKEGLKCFYKEKEVSSKALLECIVENNTHSKPKNRKDVEQRIHKTSGCTEKYQQ